MKFIDKLKSEGNWTKNNKDADAYKSTLNKNADLFASNLRFEDKEDIDNLLIDALTENESLALENVLNTIDIRTGKGERKAAREMLNFLYSKLKPEAWKELLNWTRADVLIDLYVDHNNALVIKAMWEEMKDNALIAKWMPSINTSSFVKREEAKKIAKMLGISKKEYRQTLSAARKGTIVEEKMSKNKWKDIDLKHVPAKAMMKYRSAMWKHLPDEMKTLVDNKQVKTTAVYPYEIAKIDDENDFKMFWDNQKGIEVPENANVFPVCDFSGSMTSYNGLPYWNSLGLGLYFAQHNKGLFHNKLIQFGSDFDVIELPEDSWQARQKLRRFDNCDTTNIDKVFAGLLEASKADKENAPKYVLIISDMDFDHATAEDLWTYSDTKRETNFDSWKQKYAQAGLELPKIVFWNVAGSDTFPVSVNDENTAIISGFSTEVLKHLFDSEKLSIETTMLKTLEPYQKEINKIFKTKD